ncbi:toxin glutamine deamidase domain-containing protein [Streptomyces sp. NPDC004111]|uniref:toxin glutamine deamidase domain-containing protein n=1 Tax=Streptomyces sp. NPDC004111 TaxID=3364690 RepID=UPI0036CC6E24
MHAGEREERPDAAGRVPAARPARAAGSTAADPEKEAAAPELGRGRPLSAAQLPAVQRYAGNRAATRALGERSAGRGAGPRPTVQRAPGPGVSSNRLTNNVREYGPGNLRQANEEDQARLGRVFPKDSEGNHLQFPDPTAFGSSLVGPLQKTLNKIRPGASSGSGGAADWVKGINPRRDEDGPTGAYRRNCCDAVRSFLASWSGNPTVAAGIHNPGPAELEADGAPKSKRWLGSDWRTSETGANGEVRPVWQAVESRLLGAGHGSASMVVFRKAGERPTVHAVAGVNYNGRVVWVDPQMGRVSSTPLYEGTLFMSITLDPRFAPVDEPNLRAPAPAPTP